MKFCFRYARENLALVNVYIKDPAVTQVVRDQKVPLIWFVANIGGILGLTMGMSLVTFFEIMHHVAMLFFRTGAKSLATVRRTMTVTSIQMRNRPPGNDENNIEELEEIQNEEIRAENNQRIHHHRCTNGFHHGRKQCMTVFIPPNNDKAVPKS